MTHATSPQIAPGTLIHGTLRPEDLVPAFIAALPRGEQRADFQAEWDAAMRLPEDERYGMTGAVDDLVAALMDALDDLSPENTYFGAHWGDGSDFGWWPVEEEEEV